MQLNSMWTEALKLKKQTQKHHKVIIKGTPGRNAVFVKQRLLE